MWELNYKESWAPKNWWFWTVVLEKTLESPLDSKGIQPVHPKGNQSWVFIGRTDAEAETLILWLPDVKNWLTEKDLDAGKDWRQEEKGMTENEMVEWHRWFNGHEFKQAPGVDGQEGLACCSPWDSQQSSPTPQFKSINALVLSFLYSSTLTSNMATGKTIALSRWTFVGKVMPLLLNLGWS